MSQIEFINKVKLEKTRLKPKKIELSVIGDAKTIFDDSVAFREDAEKFVDDYSDKVGTLTGTTRIITSIIDNVVEKFSDAEKELNKVRNLGDEYSSNIRKATERQKKVQDTLEKLEKSANDLGVKVDSIDIYKDLVNEDNKLERFLDFTAKRIDETRDTIDSLIEASQKINKISAIQ